MEDAIDRGVCLIMCNENDYTRAEQVDIDDFQVVAAPGQLNSEVGCDI